MRRITANARAVLQFRKAMSVVDEESGVRAPNRAVVITTSRGLADYLLARPDRDPVAPVIVGFDGRLSSRNNVKSLEDEAPPVASRVEPTLFGRPLRLGTEPLQELL